MQLSDSQISEFDERGYISIQGLLNEMEVKI